MPTDLMQWDVHSQAAVPWYRERHSIYFSDVRLYPRSEPQLSRTVPENKDLSER